MTAHASLEVAKTVLEVAEVAWTAAECCNHHRQRHPTDRVLPENELKGDSDAERLRTENDRLRRFLEKNLELLREISDAPTLSQNCPSDLHDRLVKTVSSENFLLGLESIRENSSGHEFPFDKPSGPDLEKAEVLCNLDRDKPSWWVWVPHEAILQDKEENSEIDNEAYVVINEDDVVDGVVTFIAKCILANPKAKNLAPGDLQKALTKALGGMNKTQKMLSIWHAGKLFYTLATWGLTVASLYQGRAVLKLAALGIHHSSRLALKAL